MADADKWTNNYDDLMRALALLEECLPILMVDAECWMPNAVGTAGLNAARDVEDRVKAFIAGHSKASRRPDTQPPMGISGSPASADG